MGYDTAAFGTWLTDNALPPYGLGRCAEHVRRALEAAGLNTAGHPRLAKDWGPTLLRMGFSPVPGTPMPKRGDVVVMGSTSASSAGHMEGYDGTHWVSDFVQQAFWPGPSFRKEQPAHVLYRHL